MKKVVVILTGLAFLGTAPLAMARDANRDALWTVTKERQDAKAASLKSEKKEASKEFVKGPEKSKKAKAKKKAGKKQGA